MIRSLKKAPEHISLNRLKKDIDVKIQAILRYLQGQGQEIIEQQDQFEQVCMLQSKSGMNISEIKSKRQITNHQKIGIDSTTGNRLSTEADNDANILQQQLECVRRNSQDVPTHDPIIQQRMSLDQSIFQKRDYINQKILEQSDQLKNLTPVKLSPQVIQNQSNSQKSDQSDSRRNIQQIADQKIFGVPITTSININTFQKKPEENIQQLTLSGKPQASQFVRSGTLTARSKKSNKNKQNVQFSSPCVSLQRGKSQNPKTPYKTPLSNNSGARKLLQYFAGNTRASKQITQAMIKKMRQQIQQESKKARKQAQDNNVRTKLLKRIQGHKPKPNQFLAIK